MNTIPRNKPYVPSYQEYLNLIRFLHLEWNWDARDKLIYHLSITNQVDELQPVYLGVYIGHVNVSRTKMLIQTMKSIGVLPCLKNWKTS